MQDAPAIDPLCSLLNWLMSRKTQSLKANGSLKSCYPAHRKLCSFPVILLFIGCIDFLCFLGDSQFCLSAFLTSLLAIAAFPFPCGMIPFLANNFTKCRKRPCPWKFFQISILFFRMCRQPRIFGSQCRVKLCNRYWS